MATVLISAVWGIRLKGFNWYGGDVCSRRVELESWNRRRGAGVGKAAFEGLFLLGAGANGANAAGAPFVYPPSDASFIRENFTGRVPPDHLPLHPFRFLRENPGNVDRVNLAGEGELAIPLEHFEVGFRLPLWPEMRQALRYYGVVPAQLNPNSVAILVAFIFYMRSEMIEFSLPIFQKMFIFRAKGGVVFFSGQLLKTYGLVNKHHHWGEKFVYVSGDFDNVPLAPVQYDDAA
ncbi:hypothetical protein KSP39_PZI007215 [Platanthera zijinensis]|uniref:Transposase (putative) gypsy type domain-containing protein n=1 Tax=Platanthera zijinensis TaxID=2320716 RepID=A0AAP0BR30_9ASPA